MVIARIHLPSPIAKSSSMDQLQKHLPWSLAVPLPSAGAERLAIEKMGVGWCQATRKRSAEPMPASRRNEGHFVKVRPRKY